MTRADEAPHWVTLLAAALEAVEAEGDAGLERLCAQHPELADRLRGEVRALRSAGLAGSDALAAAREAPDAPPRERIGPYTRIRLLGAGGMGEVYLAEQQEPIRRRVALKVIRSGGTGAALLARFQAERQALSRMQHEGIARVYDAGATADGAPYFAMEYVENGTPITSYCTEHRLALTARVELFARVCDALQHAHQRGILHRDLKPGNILVTTQESRPMPKVIDFGLAKALDEDLLPGSLATQDGQVMGTPEYMSPEQAAGDPRGLDTRTDVYSLGVVLYELLCGLRPFNRDPYRDSGILGLLRRVAEEEPLPPSVRISRGLVDERFLAGVGHRSASALVRGVRGDLDWIVMRALQKKREARYASMSEFAADLRRHLAGQPVLAGPPSFGYVFGKFVRRHRTLVAAGTLAVVMVSVLLGRELSNARRLAESDLSLRKAGLAQGLRSLRYEAEQQLLPVAPGTCQSAAALRAWLGRAEALCAEAERRAADLEALRQAGSRVAEGEFQFTDLRDQILHDSLAAMVAERRALLRPGDVVERVRRHLPWAESVERVTLVEAAARWQEAIASIADPEQCPPYAGRRIRPQLGLIPLRRNPQTRLWEFRFWTPEGEAPVFGEQDRVSNLGACDPVLVLLPGGNNWMGSQKSNRQAPFYFIRSVNTEQPPHQVELAPFFVSKYESTQGQWSRWTGVNPSFHQPPVLRVSDDYPVESVQWDQCDAELRSWGLLLPTEAQWEYAARAGSTDPWWTGPESISLDGKINLADRSAEKLSVPVPAYEPFIDGYAYTAPVDALAPNAFGCYHVLGNVWEWCRDRRRSSYPRTGEAGHAAGDGLLDADPQETARMSRGGSYLSTAQFARCANRIARPVLSSNPELGARAVRPLLGVPP